MIRSLLRTGLAVLACAGISAHAASCAYFDGFKSNGDGTVTDPRSGLIWQHCALGQTWAKSKCIGDGRMMTWSEAMYWAQADRFLKRSDWRLPTREEFEAVVGKHEDCLIGSPQNATKPWRAVSSVFPALRSDGYLGAFWSSTEFTTSGAWLVYFFDGGINSVGKTAPAGNARLVRTDRR